MSIAAGTRIGTYEVIGSLGAGGMGEVYRARDTRLGREVALKILPEAFASDPDRLMRFEREAKTLASLNHPHIAQIYGIEQRALVIELVEGDDLAQRLARGPIPIDEALPIAHQIAQALEAAHEVGIIHRDLKPANIKVRPDGTVKVLDFGLAKAGAADSAAGATFTSPAMTQHGVILGTAPYMSPEQAKGKAVDRRADIWAFGCVLFEMLTGRPAFEGETVTDVLAKIIEREPDWSALPRHTPVRLRSVLRQCLVKDARNRTRDMGDVRIALDEIAASPEPAREADIVAPRRHWFPTALPWALGVIALGASALAAWFALRPLPAPTPVRLAVDLGDDLTLFTALGPAAVLSPDGTMLAFVASRQGELPQLYVRRLDQLQTTTLSGTIGARDPFFSPDGEWIGFSADGKLKKVAVRGGAPITLADAPNGRGGDWSEANAIVFAPNSRSGLHQIAATGGTATALTTLADDETAHRWPHLLPGGRAVIFTATGAEQGGGTRLVAQQLPDGERTLLVSSGYMGTYLPSGHLVYVQDSTLYAVRFDAETLTLRGSPVPVLEGVVNNSGPNSAQVAFSTRGSMLYVAGDASSPGRMLWADASGRLSPVGNATGRFMDPRISPDGKQVVVGMIAQTQSDLWIFDVARDALSRLTFSDVQDIDPVWSPDGRTVAFARPLARGGAPNVHVQRADGTGSAVRLIESATAQLPFSWHTSGRFLAIGEVTDKGADILIATVESTPAGYKAAAPAPFVATPFSESEPAFSPDGRWLAYQSNETGLMEVYVAAFPGPGGRWQISTAGGGFPTWNASGKTLYFRSLTQQIMSVAYDARGEAFIAASPQRWSPVQLTDLGTVVRNFDMHPDGTRALILGRDPSQTARPKLVFVSGFDQELQRLTSR